MFGRFHYSGPFVVLFLCGIGLPLPEEVTLIGSGVLLYQGQVDFIPIVAVCSVAILLGDSVPYWLGRRYGDSILRWNWFRRMIRPGRVRLLRSRMTDHGNWVIFTCRFLPGIRVPGYFTAGLLKMSYPRFLLLDGLGVLISVPASIWLGNLFGKSIDGLKDEMQNLHLILALVALSLVLIMLVRGRMRARLRQERRDAALARLGNGSDLDPEDDLLQEDGMYEEPASPESPESRAPGVVTHERQQEGRTGD
jgi:membrane protein DedA with SNARE-associated domain